MSDRGDKSAAIAAVARAELEISRAKARDDVVAVAVWIGRFHQGRAALNAGQYGEALRLAGEDW